MWCAWCPQSSRGVKCCPGSETQREDSGKLCWAKKWVLGRPPRLIKFFRGVQPSALGGFPRHGSLIDTCESRGTALLANSFLSGCGCFWLLSCVGIWKPIPTGKGTYAPCNHNPEVICGLMKGIAKRIQSQNGRMQACSCESVCLFLVVMTMC